MRDGRDCWCHQFFFPLQVSRGVTIKADVHVPFSTVAVTRGGELSGRVVAREFLLEDGEG